MNKNLHRHKSQQALYLQIADHLRAGIVGQKWQPGDLLPSETILSQDYGVSRGTAVKAIELLMQEGMAQRRQGVGTFVTRPALHRQPGFLQGFAETVLEQGRAPSQRLLELRQLEPDEAIQNGCHEQAVLLHRVRLVDDIPWAVHRSLIPMAVASKIPALNTKGKRIRETVNFSLYQAIGDAGYIIDSAEESVQSRLATDEEARLLNIDTPAAVMMVHRKTCDPEGHLLEVIEAVYLGESYTYDVRLVRNRSVADISSASFPDRDRD